MSTNMTLITSVTVGSGGAASVTLPATGTIPQTYTDLMLVMSVRTDRANIADGYLIKPNNTTPTVRYITGDGSTAYSGTNYSGIFPAANATASTFGNAVAYFPNYANTSNNKSFSVDDVSENNATGAYATLSANLYSSTSAITTIVVQSINSANIVEGSTFYLYGISNVTSTTKATGGIVSSDGTYNYHMFPYSGTFTPTQAITAEILAIGGGGGTGNASGGGGAGGIIYDSSESLTAQAYTVTIGAGGTAGTSGAGNKGTNTTFGSLITANGGGAGRRTNSSDSNGGSGGGVQSGQTAGTASAGSGGTGYANAGAAATGTNGGYGGGGGAGAAGGLNTGGNGLNTWSTWANATQTGINGYYAGGGAGPQDTPNPNSGVAGGLGGGGASGSKATGTATGGVAGAINTGSGAGGGGIGTTADGAGAAGGSGLVIIRYAI